MNESAIIMTCVRGVVVVGGIVSKQVKEEGLGRVLFWFCLFFC